MEVKQGAGPSVDTIPEGDTRIRRVCPDCGYIAYENPKIVVGCVSTWEDQVLLCKRAIEPALGLWTIPAGFMELGETTAEGAVRETWEEATARIQVDELLGIYEIPHISQVHIFYRGRLLEPVFAPGSESLEVRLFDWPDIPWQALSFPSIVWALKGFRADAPFQMHTCERRAGR